MRIGGYALWYNRRHRRVGHLWQGRYKALLVDDGEYLLECSRYIHLNPNRSRLTRPAERYRWSSYRNYVGGPAVAQWVDTDEVLAQLRGDQRGYRSYVETRRKGRFLLYALRCHTSLRSTEIGRRQARTAAAVSVATRAIQTEASRIRAPVLGLRKLATALRQSRVHN